MYGGEGQGFRFRGHHGTPMGPRAATKKYVALLCGLCDPCISHGIGGQFAWNGSGLLPPTSRGVIHHKHWCLDSGLTAPLCPPDADGDQVANGFHQWRVCLRHAILVKGTQHRREYQELCGEAIDERKTMALYRSMRPSRERAALAVVLSGAMLTATRARKRSTTTTTDCPWQQGQDTELHQWECSRWSASRSQIVDLNAIELPYVTKCTGIVLENSTLTTQQTRQMQQHMLRVAMMVPKDKGQQRGGEERQGTQDPATHEDQRMDRATDGDHDMDDDRDRAGHGRPSLVSGRSVSADPISGNGSGDRKNRYRCGKKRARRGPEQAEDLTSELPSHLGMRYRTFTGDPNYKRLLLRCRTCGQVSGALYKQFVKNHTACAQGDERPPLKGNLTKEEMGL